MGLCMCHVGFGRSAGDTINRANSTEAFREVQSLLLQQTAEHWVAQVTDTCPPLTCHYMARHTYTRCASHPTLVVSPPFTHDASPDPWLFRPTQVAADLNKTEEEVRALWDTPMTEPVKLAHNRFITASLYFDQVSSLIAVVEA